MTEPPPLTAHRVADQLAKLAQQLDALVSDLDDAERDAVNRREDYTAAYARAFLMADGPMDIRRYRATLDVVDERIAAELADQRVKGLRRRLDSIKTRIDVGRSVGVALRAETGLAGGPSP